MNRFMIRGQTKSPESLERKPTEEPAHKVFIAHRKPLFLSGLRHCIGLVSGLSLCGEAMTSEELMDGCRATRPDLIILDSDLPDPSEQTLISVCSELGKAAPGAKILAMMDCSHPQILGISLRAGIAGIFPSSESPETLVEIIRSVLNGDIWYGENGASAIAKSLLGSRQREPSGRPEFTTRLTDRELEVLVELGNGMPNRLIASKLGLSSRTVDIYRSRLKTKLGFKDRLDLLQFAIQWRDSNKQFIAAPRA